MKRLILSLSLLFGLSSGAMAAGAGNVQLDPVTIDLSQKKSLVRGAHIFVNYCQSCHGAKYMRYNRMSEDLDLSLDYIEKNLLFGDGKKVGDLMTTTMSREDAQQWFGVAPPDLSLIARSRGTDWLYTFLRSFYLDSGSVTGWNNDLFQNVAMPNVLYPLQGSKRLVTTVDEENPGQEKHEFVTLTEGSLSDEEFDAVVGDLVNFLVYVGEPAQLQRYRIAPYVMLFLVVLTGLLYLVKREYWSDVH